MSCGRKSECTSTLRPKTTLASSLTSHLDAHTLGQTRNSCGPPPSHPRPVHPSALWLRTDPGHGQPGLPVCPVGEEMRRRPPKWAAGLSLLPQSSGDEAPATEKVLRHKTQQQATERRQIARRWMMLQSASRSQVSYGAHTAPRGDLWTPKVMAGPRPMET